MEFFDQDKIDEWVHPALLEDLGEKGDITTRAITGDKKVSGIATIYAKQDGVIAGLVFADRVFKKIDHKLEFIPLCADGDRVKKNQPISTIKGSVNSILVAERTALNFLGRLSGIATTTFKYVRIANRFNVKVLDTRKTTPGWRVVEKYAVRCGGGFNHRMGLHDMFLIKENHIQAATSIPAAIQKCRDYMNKNNFKALIEIEVRNLEQLKIAVDHSVDRILLDNIKPREIKNCVDYTRGRVELEASGNINLDNMQDYSITGVDYISVGALTHSYQTLDMSLLLEK